MSSREAATTESRNHFARNPHLAALLTSPEYCLVIQPEGYSNPNFFSGTLSTPTTIPHYLGLYLKEQPSVAVTATSEKPSFTTSSIVGLGPPHSQHLVAFGTPGVSGHEGIAHGGVLSSVLDEVLCECVEVQQRPQFSKSTYTINLDVTFKRPVAVPGDYVVRSWATHREGRKIWTWGGIYDPQGGEAYVTACAFLIEKEKHVQKL